MWGILKRPKIHETSPKKQIEWKWSRKLFEEILTKNIPIFDQKQETTNPRSLANLMQNTRPLEGDSLSLLQNLLEKLWTIVLFNISIIKRYDKLILKIYCQEKKWMDVSICQIISNPNTLMFFALSGNSQLDIVDTYRK